MPPFDASQSSLSERIRSQSFAPDLRDILLRLAELAEPPPPAAGHGGEYAEMMDRAMSPPPSGPRHKRERHLRVIPGGLAALVPAAFLFHGGAGPAVMTAWRFVWGAKHDHVRYVVVTMLLAVGGAAAVPVVATMDAAPAAGPLMLWHGHGHDRPPARPLHHGASLRYPVPVPAARTAHRRRHAVRAVLPTSAPSPSPAGAPAPSPTVTIVPSPSVSVSGLINQGVPSLTSAVLNPGPRLLAGSTVTVKHAVTSAR